MKRFKKLVCALFVILWAPIAMAQPYSGSFFEYSKLNDSSYIIKVNYYYDLNAPGSLEPDYIKYQFKSVSNPQHNISDTLWKQIGAEETLFSNCRFHGSNYGFEKHLYIDTVNLAKCNDWQLLHWPMKCVNTVTTMDDNMWISKHHINNLDVEQNTSPSFIQDPYFVMHQDQPLNFVQQAFDMDGDSLAYSFATVHKNDSTAQVYYSPLSPTNFLNSSIPITINPHTGEINLKPNIVQKTFMAIQVEEWRNINGVSTLIGVYQRENYILIDNYGNQVPQLSGFVMPDSEYHTDDTLYEVRIAPGQHCELRINGCDPDTSNGSGYFTKSIFGISWDSLVPNANLDIFHNGSDSAYAIFKWTPTANQVRSQPYCFVVNIQDSACVFSAQQSYLYKVVVDSMLIGIEDPHDLIVELKVYPNPVKDILIIEQEVIEYRVLSLYSMQGEMVRRFELNQTRKQIDLSDLPSGMYFLKSDNETNIFKKIIKI
jgi:hypothetical protein